MLCLHLCCRLPKEVIAQRTLQFLCFLLVLHFLTVAHVQILACSRVIIIQAKVFKLLHTAELRLGILRQFNRLRIFLRPKKSRDR